MARVTEHPVRARHAVAFLVSLLAILVVSLRGGGSYDLVARQEVAIAVWAVLALGWAVGVFPRTRPSRSALIILAALVALTAWTALGLTWTGSAERTSAELARVLLYLGVAALVASATDETTRQGVLGGLLAGAGLVVMLALTSRLWHAPFPVDHVAQQSDHRRMNYPFGYWNTLGAWSALVATAGLAASTTLRGWLARGLCLSITPMAVAVVYLTYSRGSVIAVAVGLFIAFAATGNRLAWLVHLMTAGAGSAAVIVTIRAHDAIARNTGTAGARSVGTVVVGAVFLCAAVAVATGREPVQRWRMPSCIARVVGAATVVGVAIIVIGFGPQAFDKAKASFERPVANETSSDPAARLTNLSGQRVNLWRSGLDAFDREPLHGIGPGTYEFWWNRDRRWNAFVRDGHSLYLEALAEMGVIGLIAVLALGLSLLAGILVSLRTRDRNARALAATAAVALSVWAITAGFDWMWESTGFTVLVLAMAVTVSAGGRFSTPPSRARSRVRLRIALTGVAVLALAAELPGLVSESQVRSSQRAAASGSPSAALMHATDAVSAQPWGMTGYLQRALVEESLGQLAAGEQDARRAAARERDNWIPWLILARIAAERGRVPAATAAYLRAQQDHPKFGRGLRRLGLR